MNRTAALVGALTTTAVASLTLGILAFSADDDTNANDPAPRQEAPAANNTSFAPPSKVQIEVENVARRGTATVQDTEVTTTIHLVDPKTDTLGKQVTKTTDAQFKFTFQHGEEYFIQTEVSSTSNLYGVADPDGSAAPLPKGETCDPYACAWVIIDGTTGWTTHDFPSAWSLDSISFADDRPTAAADDQEFIDTLLDGLVEDESIETYQPELIPPPEAIHPPADPSEDGDNVDPAWPAEPVEPTAPPDPSSPSNRSSPANRSSPWSPSTTCSRTH